MNESQTATIETEVPLGLLTQVQKLVDSGWFLSLDDVMLDALRRFVESHRTEIMEEFIGEDIEWGLRGDE
jgi:Arc/MetJ-type ribon-helix-helix transcriptional regulator